VPAPRGNQFAKGSKTNGRPTGYRAQFAQQAKSLCEGGATLGDLARFFEVSVSTIKLWRAQYEDFSTALRIGRQRADELVESALFMRCIGYDHDVDIGGGETLVRHLPPDIGAIKMWLYNRQPGRWREKVEAERAGGMSDRTPLELKRMLVRRMIQWKLVDPRNVPPDLLPPPDGTVDDDD
jgi:hypothetical protein